MNIAVCVKQTPDTTTRVQIRPDQKGISEDGIKWVINPYDEFAIEEALQLAEKNGGEVTIVTLGNQGSESTIREALAMGAHKAIRINVDRVPDDPVVTAKALAEVLEAGGYDMILLGKQAIDDDQSQMPSMVAQALDLPCVSSVVNLEVDGTAAKAKREIEGGYEYLTFTLPAVIGAHRHLNEPRYRTLKGIMQAKKKTIEVIEPSLADAKLSIEVMTPPPAKSAGKMYPNGAEAVPEVVRELREVAKVI